MFDLIFDHYTIKVRNLDASATFYKKVLGLKEITNRTQKSYIRWFSMGDGSELHIVEGDSDRIKTNVGVHLALRLKNFDEFLSHLSRHNINQHNSKGIRDSITTRADGIRQVYFQDPDGYWIEVNEAGTLSNE
ncbi:VOC family protein [Rhodohalobacter sp. 614A]|uniref:VOC family protein n=1 Tax=Rhodohalobacter sp. 614A TaxID=2908649 RepID=UPI001F3704A8|nr:VOC family protein [Rhodohalobacter sp. 614A]